MSEQSLREALEEICALGEKAAEGQRARGLRPTPPFVPVDLVRDTLAAHPVESVPRPVIDREAVENAIATKAMHYNSGTAVHEVDDNDLAGLVAATDAVMELARPMPTQEEIADVLREHKKEAIGDVGVRCICGNWGPEVWPEHLAGAVLALLNGSES